ncbi:hypothetical protein B0H14DRAFT_2736967, partial [Mycena olivaceomarginata]
HNVIDDASPLIVYRAPSLDRNLTGFEPDKLKDGTVTFIAATQNDSPTISMNFTGTAIYVFVAYPAGHNTSFPSGFIARIDDIPSGGWSTTQTAPFYDYPAYSNTTLANKPHNLVLQIQPGWELYFDYVRYISGNATASTSPPKKEIPVGAIVGGVIGGAVLLALILTPFFLRRRANARRNAKSFMIKHNNTGGSEKEKEENHPSIVPFQLQSPVAAPSERTSQKSTSLRLEIPTSYPRMSSQEAVQSPLSATSDPGLLLVAEEMRRMTAAMQRWRQGFRRRGMVGPVLQRPPAYGGRDSI